MTPDRLRDADASTAIDRRRLLAAVGGTLTTGLAGCSDLTTREFEADPHAIRGDGMRMLGFETLDHEEREWRREVSAGGFEGEVVLRNHAVTYGHDATVPAKTSWEPTTGDSWSAAVLSTPAATVGGQALNPLAERPLEELLVGDLADRFRSLVGLGADAGWVCRPERIGGTTGRMLGKRTDLGVYAGVTETDGGLATVAIYGARVVVDGDTDTAVLAGVVDRRRVPGDTSERACGEDFDRLLSKTNFDVSLDRLPNIGKVYVDIGEIRVPPNVSFNPRPWSVSAGNARLVQICEGTDLTSGSAGPISDPPILQGMNAAGMFTLSGQNLGQLPATGFWAELTITEPSGNTVTERFRIPKTAARKMASGVSPAAEFHRLARDGNSQTTPPVFDGSTVDYDRAELRLLVGSSLTPIFSTSWNVTTAGVRPLFVGFIEVIDPKGGTPTTYKGETVSFGDANGRAANYERSVNSSFEYLKRTYPGDVIGYRHDVPMKAQTMTHKPDDYGGSDADSKPELDVFEKFKSDAAWAEYTLQPVTGNRNFPTNGTIYHHHVSHSRAEALISRHGFDVTVMILPRGTASGNTHYYAAHGMGGVGGMFVDTSWAVGSLEARGPSASRNDVGHASTTAQEIGHYFAYAPYNDGSSDPYSRTYTKNGQTKNDVDHANANLVSTGYSLTDGTFTRINDLTIADGTFDPGAPGAPTSSPSHTSYMSYTGGTKWADNRITNYVIKSEYRGIYKPGSNPNLPSASGAAGGTDGTTADASQGRSHELQPVFAAHGRVHEGRVLLEGSAVYDGTPVDTGDLDVERRLEANDAQPVEVRLLGPRDELVRSAVVPDRFALPHGDETLNAVAISLPFDEGGVWLDAAAGDRRTRANAIVHPLRTAVEQVPARGLVEGEAGRGQLLEVLDAADAAMRERRYDRAVAVLDDEFAPAVERTVVEYEAQANEPTAERLLTLSERLAERLREAAGG